MMETEIGAAVGQDERSQKRSHGMTPETFKNEVYTWAKEIRVQPKEVHIRSMKRKLASCSSKGRLTFDISLLQECKDVRDKAVVHELLHLKYPNHGKMFSVVLRTYVSRGNRKRVTLCAAKNEK